MDWKLTAPRPGFTTATSAAVHGGRQGAAAFPLTVEQVARHFHHAPRKKVRGLLETLEALGLVEQAGDAAFAA